MLAVLVQIVYFSKSVVDWFYVYCIFWQKSCLNKIFVGSFNSFVYICHIV